MRERCIGWILVVALASACRGEPAASLAPSSAPERVEEPARTPIAAQAPAAATVAPAAASAAAAPGPPLPVDESAPLPLVDPSGSPLPQTEERPTSTGPRFQRRMQELARAIREGEPEHGRASFFPVLAYAQVKAVERPERDFRFRLMANFERDIREYRKALGRDAAQAEFLGVDVPEEKVQWMKPGSEGNRLGYFRVLRAKLRFRMPNGSERALELTSMISWRGEWYVVHLHGFK